MHTWLYYLKDNSVMDGTTKSLNVTLGTGSSSEANMTVWYTVFAGVDQSPATYTTGNGINNSSGNQSAQLSSAMIVNANEQAVYISNIYNDGGSTIPTYTISSNWNSSGNNTGTNTTGGQTVSWKDEVAKRTISGSGASDNAATTSFTNSTRFAMSAMSLPRAPVTYTSITTGNWNSNATWDKGSVPIAGSNVIIANGHTVTSDVNSAALTNLDINGTLDINTFTVSGTGTLTISSTGTLRVAGTSNFPSFGTYAFNVASTVDYNAVGGTNQTINASPTYGNLILSRQSGSGNTTKTAGGSLTIAGDLTISANATFAAGTDVQSAITIVANGLTLTNGTFKWSNVGSINLSGGNNLSVPATAGLWVNGGTVGVGSSGASLTLSGLLHASAGTLNIGTSTGNNINYSTGSTITFDGGNVVVDGRLMGTSTGQTTTFNMSGGTLTVANVTYSVASSPSFDISAAGSSFTMSGGTIIIQNENTNGTPLDYRNIAGTVSITGGTVQFASATTPSTPTFVVGTSGTNIFLSLSLVKAVTSTTVTLSAPITVRGNVSIASGTTLNASLQNITVTGNSTDGGDWTNNGGTFTSGTQTVTFNNTGADQNINGTTVSQTFNSVTVAKSSQKLIIGGSTTLVTLGATSPVLTMTSGNIDCGTNTLELGTGTTATTIGILTYSAGNIIGSFRRWFNSTTGAKTFPLGTSAGSGTTTANRNALVTFTNLTNGSLTGEFIATDPGSTGLPLTESSVTINNQYTEGYWSLVAANSLVSTNYALELTGTGFSSQGTEDANTRIIKRPSGGGSWILNGTHVADASSVAKRTGLSGFSEFAHARGVVCPTTPSAGSNSPVCVGSTLNLTSSTATGSFLSYSWTGPNGFSSAVQNPSITGVTTAAAGTYTVTISNDACGSVQASTNVTMNAVPDISNFSIASVTSPILAGSTSAVTINSTSLGNGNSFTATYTLTGSNTGTFTSSSFTIASNSGTFNTTALANTGTTTITITSIKNASNCSSAVSSNTASIVTVPAKGSIIYTANDVFTPTVCSVTVEAWGGGGAGGGTDNTSRTTGGGGGGRYFYKRKWSYCNSRCWYYRNRWCRWTRCF